jgi:hypothetical protein
VEIAPQGQQRPTFIPWRGIAKMMARDYGIPPETWRKWTLRELWVYASDATDPGFAKKIDVTNSDLNAKAIIGQRKQERDRFVAQMLGEPVPDGLQTGRSVCRIQPEGRKRRPFRRRPD